MQVDQLVQRHEPIDLTRLRDFSDGTESGLRDLAALFVTHMEECLLAIRRGVAERMVK